MSNLQYLCKAYRNMKICFVKQLLTKYFKSLKPEQIKMLKRNISFTTPLGEVSFEIYFFLTNWGGTFVNFTTVIP